MKKQIITLIIVLSSLVSNAQTKSDLFNQSDVKISWLGVDFSHVKLIGDFSQFSSAGEQSTVQIRDVYFPKWNRIILNEPNKYDIKGMLRKGGMSIDIDMLMKLNSKAALENMETYNVPNYPVDSITHFINTYELENKNGIGVFFIAECLNKINNEAYFHFVAINMKTKELIFHERLRGVPGGFGLRNYWAHSIYSIIKDIKNNRYYVWKAE